MEAADTLGKMLAKKQLLVLDGGMGILIFRAIGRDNKIWALRSLSEEANHDKVVDAHQQFIAAGADVIITSNYSAVPMFVSQIEGGLERLVELNATAGKLARKAIDTFEFPAGEAHQILVAGSLPPLEGSFNPNSKMTAEELEAAYEEIILGLKEHVDFYIAETMGSIKEGLAAGRAIRKFDPEKKFFISWSTDENGVIRSGECVQEAVRQAEADEGAQAFGYMLNCGPPEKYVEMLAKMALETEKPLGAYSNLLQADPGYTFPSPAGETPFDREISLDDFEKVNAAIAASKNLRFLGGCCFTFPEHIERIAQISAKLH